MTLVDPTEFVSVEYGALEDVAALLALCHGFHCLNNGDEDTAAEKIVIEEEIDPWDVDRKFTRKQLEEILLRAFVESPEDSPHETTPDEAASSSPREGGTIQIRIYRQILEDDYASRGRAGCMRWFRKCVGAIVGELPLLAQSHVLGYGVELGPVRQVKAAIWNGDTEVSAQGRVLWQPLEVDWGDRGGGGGEQ